MAGGERSEDLTEQGMLWGKAFTWKIRGAQVEDVWAIVSDFVGVDKWVTSFAQSELVQGEPQKPGCVRRIAVRSSPSQPSTGAFGIEKLLLMDPASHHYVYTLLGCNMPGFCMMKNYVAALKLSSLSSTLHAPISSFPSRVTHEDDMSCVADNTTNIPTSPAPSSTPTTTTTTPITTATTFAIAGGDSMAINLPPSDQLHEEEATLLHWSFTCHPIPSISEEDLHRLVFSLYGTAVHDLKEHLALPNNSITLLS